jgi:hypothetical protein
MDTVNIFETVFSIKLFSDYDECFEKFMEYGKCNGDIILVKYLIDKYNKSNPHDPRPDWEWTYILLKNAIRLRNEKIN